eukprot:CAMPEP_0113699192 /NCGR_PEP_ID=MMETSP0038_2-20120614/23153_1 /TAXON_ID=2898 /ORGANISM="Cryptomonas paramecium" /LENGTH=161 /DNA_ID=CAMNT_0000622487 /DNA_START=40 /DNA_END=524 /DNA_ORIENTATION=- /assembly_acc=CAM_ASM_000170
MNNFEDIFSILRPDVVISSLLCGSMTDPREGARDAPAGFVWSQPHNSSDDEDENTSSGASASPLADIPALGGWTPDQLQAFARALECTKDLKCQSTRLPKGDAGRSMYEHWFRMQKIAADAAWEEPDRLPPVLPAHQGDEEGAAGCIFQVARARPYDDCWV